MAPETEGKSNKIIEKCWRWSLIICFLALLILSYYLYVVVLWVHAVEGWLKTVVLLLLYHFVLFLLCWSYWQAIFTRIATTPEEFFLPRDVLHRLKRKKKLSNRNKILLIFCQNLPVYTRLKNGAIRYCKVCEAIKPDRSHHCSVCHKCVLKMDHHCPWTNNCAGFTNYKFLILTFTWGLVYNCYIAGTCFTEFSRAIKEYNSDHPKMRDFLIIFMFVSASLLALSLLPMTIGHYVLIAKNRTTIEVLQHPIFENDLKTNLFDVGCYKNFQSVFGSKPHLWFIPVYTNEGDGVNFPMRRPEEEKPESVHLIAPEGSVVTSRLRSSIGGTTQVGSSRPTTVTFLEVEHHPPAFIVPEAILLSNSVNRR